MTIEFRPRAGLGKKGQEAKWHASAVEKEVALISACWLGMAEVIPDPELKAVCAGAALMLATCDLLFLGVDGLEFHLRKKVAQS